MHYAVRVLETQLDQIKHLIWYFSLLMVGLWWGYDNFRKSCSSTKPCPVVALTTETFVDENKRQATVFFWFHVVRKLASPLWWDDPHCRTPVLNLRRVCGVFDGPHCEIYPSCRAWMHYWCLAEAELELEQQRRQRGVEVLGAAWYIV